MQSHPAIRITVLLVGLLAGGPFLAAQDEAGRGVFDTVLTAYGQRAAVQSLTSYRLTGTIRYFYDDEVSDAGIEILYKKPDKFKQVVTLAGETVTLGRNAAEWWDAEGVDRLTVRRRHLERREVVRHQRRLELELCNLLAYPPGQLAAQLLPDPVAWDGREYWVLKIWQKHDASRWLKLLVDPATRLIRRADTYLEDAATDTYEEFGCEFLDYAPQGKVQFPRRIRQYQDGRLVSEIQVKTVAFNTQIAASEFKPE